MKPKTILLAASFILASCAVRAADTRNDPGKKDDIVGSVSNADNKKPLKDVSVTAYYSSRKEKVVITDGCGTYSFNDLKPGSYKFVFEKDGFKKVVKEKIIKVDEGFQLDIEMVKDEGDEILPSPSHFLYN